MSAPAIEINPGIEAVEAAIIAEILVGSLPVKEVCQHLKADDFRDERHCLIFRAAVQLYNEGKPADLVMVKDLLAKRGELANAGGASYIGGLQSDAICTGHWQYYIRILKENIARRAAKSIGQDIIRAAERGRQDAEDILADAADKIRRISPPPALAPVYTHGQMILRRFLDESGSGLDLAGNPNFAHDGTRYKLFEAINTPTGQPEVDQRFQAALDACQAAMDQGGDAVAGANAAWAILKIDADGQRREREQFQGQAVPSAADVLSTAQLMRMKFPEREDIVPEWWRFAGHGAITAREGIGKTTLDMVLARDLANGVPPLPGWDFPRPYKVLYADMELPLEYTQRKFADVNGRQPLPENLFWLSAETLEPYGGLDLGSEHGKQIFMNILDEVQADVTMMDTVVYAFKTHNPAFEPVDSTDFARYVAALRLRKHGVIWSAHTSKAGDTSTMYGSVIQNFPQDWIINLEAGSQPGRLTMRFTKHRWAPPKDRELDIEVLWRPDGVHLRSMGPPQSLDLRLLELVHAAAPPLRSINALLEAAKRAGVSKSKGTVSDVVKKYRLKKFMEPDDPLRLSKSGREVLHFDE